MRGGMRLVRGRAGRRGGARGRAAPAAGGTVTARLEGGDDTAAGILAARRPDPQAAPGVEAT
ncbi:hypothetical protein, partial [Azospirillum brasilense]|uniref:hypothetical protein n=1 Tax=Azospirillum brasilense TaxID=192 RepID=UPI001B3BBCC9